MREGGGEREERGVRGREEAEERWLEGEGGEGEGRGEGGGEWRERE